MMGIRPSTQNLADRTARSIASGSHLTVEDSPTACSLVYDPVRFEPLEYCGPDSRSFNPRVVDGLISGFRAGGVTQRISPVLASLGGLPSRFLSGSIQVAL
jgi:hypothetical protein